MVVGLSGGNAEKEAAAEPKDTDQVTCQGQGGFPGSGAALCSWRKKEVSQQPVARQTFSDKYTLGLAA